MDICSKLPIQGVTRAFTVKKLLQLVVSITFITTNKGKIMALRKVFLVLNLCLLTACATEKQLVNDTPPEPSTPKKERELSELRKSIWRQICKSKRHVAGKINPNYWTYS